MNATSAPSDREISLGTGTILGLFFALAVVCAVFFGFGYSVGSNHHSHIPVSVNTAEPAANPVFSTFKPAPGSPAATPAHTATPAPADPAVSSVTVPIKVNKPVAFDPDANIVTSVDPVAKPVKPTAPASTIVPSTSAIFVVQVAAVTHQEDADLLVTNLRRRGYNVAIHSEAQDKLLHVQIGSFPTKKDADVMRQRLLGDGFNAIVK